MRVLPVLFNTDMVRAILDGRKTVTRRCVKYKYSNTEMKMHTDKYGTRLIEIQKDIEGETHGKNPDGSTWHKLLGYVEPKPPYQPGDILYVRETWYRGLNRILYKANYSENEKFYTNGKEIQIKWHPSIHMPKEAARIWIKVKDVRVERLQDITEEQASSEGVPDDLDYPISRVYCPRCHGEGLISAIGASLGYMEVDCPNCDTAIKRFKNLWNSTIKKSDLDRYGWDANPWVWVIEFERCEKPEVI